MKPERDWITGERRYPLKERPPTVAESALTFIVLLAVFAIGLPWVLGAF